MTRIAYYNQLRMLALEKREQYSVTTPTLNLLCMRRMYKGEGIKIDLRSIKGNKIRAAYFCDDGDYSVLLNRQLPREPRLFSLAHELKHHYVDQQQIQEGAIRCGDYNAHEFIEKGAEVFAAEFIYPEAEMRELVGQLGIAQEGFTPETIVHFKRACPAPVSYSFLVKRFAWFGFCVEQEFKQVQFQKLEEKIFGTPIYKQRWFKQYRARRRKTV